MNSEIKRVVLTVFLQFLKTALFNLCYGYERVRGFLILLENKH